MGLEAFDFIPDLVATNPEPTDPVAQGDDHLRGIKFTLQNQWPNIGDNAVTRTALQMNDAALRSESNTFSEVNLFRKNVALFPLNTTDNIQLGYTDNAGVTLWGLDKQDQDTSNNLRFLRHDAAGVFVDTPLNIRFSDGRVTLANQLLGADGTEALPGYSFGSDDTLGMYRQGAGVLSFAVSAAELLRVTSTALTPFSPQVRMGSDGTASQPAYSFVSDPSMGMFRAGTNQLALGVNAIEQFRVTNNVARFTNRVEGADGDAAAPAWSFTSESNKGMYSDAANGLGFATSGVRRMFLGNNSMLLQNAVVLTLIANMNARKASTTSVAGYNFQDATPVTRWALQITTDASGNNLALRRSNSAGTSQGDLMLWKQNGNISMPQLPVSNAGLVAGDLWRNPVTPTFVSIV